MLLTFFLAVIGWIVFRSSGMPSALHYLEGMLQFGTLRASYQFFTLPEMWPTNLFIILMLVVEWLQRGKEHGLNINVGGFVFDHCGDYSFFQIQPNIHLFSILS